MTGDTLETLATELNGGAAIGDTLLYQFFNLAKAMVEQLRPWKILRLTDTSKTVSASSTSAWQILSMLTKWDNDKQQSSLAFIDPYNPPTSGYRSGAINMN